MRAVHGTVAGRCLRWRRTDRGGRGEREGKGEEGGGREQTWFAEAAHRPFAALGALAALDAGALDAVIDAYRAVSPRLVLRSPEVLKIVLSSPEVVKIPHVRR